MITQAPASASFRSQARAVSVPLETLRAAVEDWLFEHEYRNLSARTIESRRSSTGKMLDFFAHRGIETVGYKELRLFIGDLKSPEKNLSDSTIHHHYRNIHTLFGWMEREELIPATPFVHIPPPINRDDEVNPFTPAEFQELLAQTKFTINPARDKALLLFLLDTGARATEVCDLKYGDLNINEKTCRVQGKGGKQRTLAYSYNCSRALWKYLRDAAREDDSPVFISESGGEKGRPLTRHGLYQIISRLAKAAGITRKHIGPHTIRHTFAIEFLRLGGNLYALQQMLGHTDLTITRRYAAFAEADIVTQSRRFSPADKIGR